MLPFILNLYLYQIVPKNFACPVFNDTAVKFIDMQCHNPKRGTGFAVNPRRWCLYQLAFTAHAIFFQHIFKKHNY